MVLPHSALARFRKPLLSSYLLLTAAAFICTHLPGNDIPNLHVTDKTLHVFGFFGLATVLLLTLAAYGVSRVVRLLICLAVLAVYGAVDEYTQQFFRRSTDFYDWCADMVGTFGALVVWEILLALFVHPKAPRNRAGFETPAG